MAIVRVTIRNQEGPVGVFQKDFSNIAELFPGHTVIHVTKGRNWEASLIIDISSMIIHSAIGVEMRRYYNAVCNSLYERDIVVALMREDGWTELVKTM